MDAFHRCCCVAALAIVLGLIVCAGAVAAGGALSGRIVFEHHPDKQFLGPTCDIYMVNADGTGLRALMTDGHSHNPSWSPDGRQILFVHNTVWPSGLPKLIFSNKKYTSNLPIELYAMNCDGSNVHLLRRLEGHIAGAAFSPDGKTIAVSYYRYPTKRSTGSNDRVVGIYLLPADGQGKLHVLVPDSNDPSWSPNGKMLAFSQRVTGGWAIAVSNADGSHVVHLTDPHRYTVYPYYQFAFSPAWSPDGKWIAFDAEKTVKSGPGVTSGHQVFLIRSDGRDLRQLTTNPDWYCFHPSWSTDGREIAFSCRRMLPLSACSWRGEGGIPSGPLPPCVQRIFVMKMNHPHAKPIQITHIDSWDPSFSPVR